MPFYCSDSGNKGFGDWIEGRTHTFGLDKLATWWAKKVLRKSGCKCQQRRNQLNSLYPCDTPKLTIGIPTYNDFEGLHATVTSLVLQAEAAGLLDRIEILVIDQSPDPQEMPEGQPQPQAVRSGEMSKGLIEEWIDGAGGKLQARYIRWNHNLGTTVAKSMCFQASRTEWTMCLDSHVVLSPGSLENTYRWICDNRFSYDLYHGVLIYDGLKGISTHLEPVWRGQMWGTWATDDRGIESSLVPFEVPAAAGWSFMCRTDAWLGYHPLMKGFGGEETFLQKLWQQNDRKTFCLPCFRGVHRFGRTAEMAPVRLEDKIRNYALGLTMLGIDLREMRDHFAEPHEEEGQTVHHMNANQVDLIIAGAVSEHMNAFGIPKTENSSASLPNQPTFQPTLEDMYTMNVNTKSDIQEHLPTLKKYASECDRVTEFGPASAVSTVALLAGQPKSLDVWTPQETCTCNSLKPMSGNTEFNHHVGISTEVDPIPETDLLFLDTYHHKDQMDKELALHAGSVTKYIILHDTTTFWENGESYDGTPRPGLKYAVEPFLQNHPEWSVRERFENNNGLLVLERANVEGSPEEAHSDHGAGQVRDVVSGAAAGRARARLRRQRAGV